jgi:presequence protease
MKSNFTLLTFRTIPEINSTVKLYKHDKTGARILSIANDDENKCFGITFRTPPQTSNGVAHIMEHSVLCGSRKYQVKEPFVELVKGSLNTFLNAMTYPDKTTYPVASVNLKDFYNLVDVYLDAVFYPLIPEHTLMQEGWHYELESPAAPLTFKGVVFNEMKGAYSDPDNVLGDRIQHSLYPDTSYGLDSGGDPLVIPDLTYAQFKAFHENYYHPSNAFIYFYGDDDPAERLRILETWLQDFDPKPVDSLPGLQSRFSQPRQVIAPYDAGDAPDAKSYITVNWLLPENGDAQTTLGMSILSHILTATPASPLRKALIDSGLGEDLAGNGLTEDLRQMNYSTGLKGVARENVDKIEALILATLSALAKDGIDPETVAASLNTVEFVLREKNTGRFPRGLLMMLNALSTWLYDGDPLAPLAFEAPLAAIKAQQSVRYFENLIQQYYLDNPHRTTVILEPDAAEGKRREAVETERLARVKAGMSAAELEKIIETAEQLRVRQETPDSAEALATIPSLKLSDIDKSSKIIPIDVNGAVLYHDLFTNGIVYLDLGFDLHSLPQMLLPYAGLFGRALLEMGTAREDFVRLTQRIGRSTGGIRPAALTATIRETDQATLWLFLRGKAVAGQADDLLNILKDVLLSAKMDDRERFKQIVLEEKSGLEAGLVPGGHHVVNSRLRARFTLADWASEQMGGISQLFFLRSLAERIEKDWPGVQADLEAVRAALINRSTALANVTLDAENYQKFSPALAAFMESLPTLAVESQKSKVWQAFDPQHSTPNEGLTIPAQVNYVGKGAHLYDLGYEPDGSVNVINNYLGTTWLWEKIRVQGGAYGGFSSFDHNSGVFTFLSYRDPNLLATLENYDHTAKFLRELELSAAELEKSIIGTIGDLDAYLLPDAKGWTSMARWLTHYTDAERQKVRDEVLGASLQDFKQFAEILARLAEKGEVVVLGSAEAIEKANKERDGLLDVKKVM